MSDPVLIWRGKLVMDMSREELVVALDEACGQLRANASTVTRSLETLKMVYRKKERLARADGIFIGIILGGLFGVAVGVLSASAFFLLT